MDGKLDTVVEHRAGSNVGHFDALSLYVGTLIQGGTSDKENVPRKRAKKPLVLNRPREPVAKNASFSQIATIISAGENQR